MAGAGRQSVVPGDCATPRNAGSASCTSTVWPQRAFGSRATWPVSPPRSWRSGATGQCYWPSGQSTTHSPGPNQQSGALVCQLSVDSPSPGGHAAATICWAPRHTLPAIALQETLRRSGQQARVPVLGCPPKKWLRQDLAARAGVFDDVDTGADIGHRSFTGVLSQTTLANVQRVSSFTGAPRTPPTAAPKPGAWMVELMSKCR